MEDSAKKIFLRLLLIAIPFAILFFVCIEFILPPIAVNSIEDTLKKSMQTDNVTFTVETTPRFLITFGRLDEAHAEIVNGKISGFPMSLMNIDFKNTQMDFEKFFLESKIVFGNDDIFVKSVINEENLREFIETKLPDWKLDKFQIKDVKINSDAIRISGSYPMFNQSIDVNIAGTLEIENGSLFVKMSSLNVNSPIMRQANIDSIPQQLKILDSENLMYGLHLKRVELRDGSILLEAEKLEAKNLEAK